MSAANFLSLVALAAIWGSSFLFMRIGAPVLGPALLIEYRVFLAAVFLAIVGLVLKRPLDLGRHWKHYLILGLLNSALPFLMFGYAARTLPASVMAVLNATAPIWGALIGAVWTRQALVPVKVLGLVLGLCGVTVLVGFDTVVSHEGAGVALAAGLLAAVSYGFASLYTKMAKTVEPFANAHSSMWAAVVLVLPALPFFPPQATPGYGVMGAVLALGVLCTGIAYMLYFRLVRDVGATPALSVTFMVPLFGILWGKLFLGEAVGWHTVAGSVVVLLGTALVTGFRPSLPWLPHASDT